MTLSAISADVAFLVEFSTNVFPLSSRVIAAQYTPEENYIPTILQKLWLNYTSQILFPTEHGLQLDYSLNMVGLLYELTKKYLSSGYEDYEENLDTLFIIWGRIGMTFLSVVSIC